MKVEFKRSWVWDVLSSAVAYLEKQHGRLYQDYGFVQARLQRLQAQKNTEVVCIKLEQMNEDSIPSEQVTENEGIEQGH